MFTFFSRQKRCELCRKWMPKNACSFGDSLCDCCSPIRHQIQPTQTSKRKVVSSKSVQRVYAKYNTFDGTNIRSEDALVDRLFREKDSLKIKVFEMFLWILRLEKIPLCMWHTPGQLKRIQGSVLI